jgi:hypothetical protein
LQRNRPERTAASEAAAPPSLPEQDIPFSTSCLSTRQAERYPLVRSFLSRSLGQWAL